MNSCLLPNNRILYFNDVSGIHSLSAGRCSSHEAAITEFLAFDKVVFVRVAAAGTGNNQMDYVLRDGRRSRKSSTFPGLMTLNSASEIPLFGNIIHKKHDFLGLYSRKAGF